MPPRPASSLLLAGLLRGAASFALDQPTQSLGAALAAAGIGRAPALDLALGLALGAGLLLYVFKDPSFRRSRLDLQLGLGLGTLIALGFVLTGWLQAATLVEPHWAVASLTFVAPIAEAQLWAMTGDGVWPGFGAALVARHGPRCRAVGRARPGAHESRRSAIRAI